MATIIPFPTQSDRALENAIAVISDRLIRAGLTQEQRDEAVAELCESLPPMFKVLSLPLEIPNELGLTPLQIEGVFKVIEEFHDRVKSAYAENLAYAANVIAGLTARSVLQREGH